MRTFKTGWLLVIAALLGPVRVDAGMIPNGGFEAETGWQFEQQGVAWEGRYVADVAKAGKQSYEISFPERTESGKGQYGGIFQHVMLSPEDKGLSFWVKKSYSGATRYYHQMQLLLDDVILWQEDAAGGTDDWWNVTVNLTPYVKAKREYRLGFRVKDDWCVDNFPFRMWVDEVALHTEAPTAKPAAAPASLPDWFSPTMINEVLYAREPAETYQGRVIMFFDPRWGYDQSGIRRVMRNVKRMGFTDVLYPINSGNQLGYPTDLPLSRRAFWLQNSAPQGADVFKMLLEACQREGLKVWLGGHAGEYDASMCAHDQEGALYRYGGRGIDDFLSPQLKDYLRSLIRDIMAKYGAYGVIEGYYYDEPFFTKVDFHGAHLDAFAHFCQERFEEEPPADLAGKIALKDNWMDPADVWWRRSVLFHNHVNTDFQKFLVQTLHQAGLKSMLELRPPAALGWRMGMDLHALTRIGADCFFVAAADYCAPALVYPTAWTGAHEGNSWGFYQTYCFRGKPASFFYADKLIHSYLTNPREDAEAALFTRNIREWNGGRSLARVAVLTSPNSLILKVKHAPAEAQKEVRLFKELSFYVPTEMLLTQETERYENYRVLVAPPYSLVGMTGEELDALLRFVREGGVLVSVKGRATVSRADLTEEQSRAVKLCGLEVGDDEAAVKALMFGGQAHAWGQEIKAIDVAKARMPEDMTVVSRFENGQPAVLERSLGKGRVVTLLFDPTDIQGTEEVQTLAATHDLRIAYEKEQAVDETVIRYVSELILARAQVEIQSDGGLRIMNALKKNNWVGVALWGDRFPAAGKIAVNVAALGLKAPSYRLYLLARGHEYLKDYGGMTRWSAEDLKDGIHLRIPVDNAKDKELAYVETRHPAAELMYLNWKQRPMLRAYEHEILVVAPADESGIEQEHAR